MPARTRRKTTTEVCIVVDMSIDASPLWTSREARCSVFSAHIALVCADTMLVLRRPWSDAKLFVSCLARRAATFPQKRALLDRRKYFSDGDETVADRAYCAGRHAAVTATCFHAGAPSQGPCRKVDLLHAGARREKKTHPCGSDRRKPSISLTRRNQDSLLSPAGAIFARLN